MPLPSSLARHENGLCLLTFDAGGSRGISQLKILAELMHRMNIRTRSSKMERPCSVFNMIGGVGSGGLIAILLVIFGLTAIEALDEFINLSVNVLDKPKMDIQARTAALNEHFHNLPNKYGIDPSMRLLDPNDHSQGCKLAIPISYKLHIESTCILRNYPVRQEQALNLTIVEALLATLATPPLFEPISIVKDSGRFEYIGAEMTLSNPTDEIIAEAHRAFGADERVACILSVGCGLPGIFKLPESPKPVERIRFLENLIMDAQQKAQNLESRMEDLGIYHRFSVDSGLERENSVTTLDSGDIVAYTEVYINDGPVSRKLDTCIDSLRARDGVSSLERLKSSGGKTALSPRLPPVTTTFVMRKEPWEFVNEIILGPRESQDIDEPRILVVTGIKGCGKTQLMLQFMKVHRERFASLFFIDGSSEDQIRTDMVRNIRALGNEHSQKGFNEGLLFLSEPSGDGMRLLLYDNVDDPNLDLLPLLPQGDSCAIVITSRNRILGDLYPDYHLSLDVMSVDESVELLLYRSVSITDQVREEAIELAQALGCLPIALQQALEYMQQTKCSMGDCILRLPGGRSRHLGQVDMQAISTYAAFETSFARLETHVKKLLWLLAHFHWSGFPLELVVMLAVKHNFEYERILVKPGHKFYVAKKMLEDIFFLDGKWDVTHMDEMVISLQSYSLVTIFSGVNTSLLQVHPLMTEWLLPSVPKDERGTYQDAAVLLLALGARRDHTPATQYLSSHVAHLRPLWDQLCINDASAFGSIMYRNGTFKGALYLQEAVVRELTKEPPPDDTEISYSTRELALTYCASGHLKEAAILQHKVMELNKSTLGQRHSSTIAASNNLANIYLTLGRLSEAQVLQEEVLKLRKEILGEKHPDTIDVLIDMAAIYRALGLLSETESLQVTVLTTRNEVLGENHPDTVKSSHELAITYCDQGRLEEALVAMESVLKSKKEILSENHPHTILASSDLATILRRLGRLNEAEVLATQVVKLRIEIFGCRHPDTLISSSKLASLYCDLGRLKEAEALQLETLVAMKEVLGEQHYKTTGAVLVLAHIYISCQRKADALGLLTMAEATIFDVLGTTHPQYLECYKLMEEAETPNDLVQVLQDETQPSADSSTNTSLPRIRRRSNIWLKIQKGLQRTHK